jgi:hypothetical protein
MLNYDALTEEDYEKIRKILLGFPKSDDLRNSVIAAHLAKPLNLGTLLEFDETERTCDVYAIHRFVDQETGRLTAGFSPKCGFRKGDL